MDFVGRTMFARIVAGVSEASDPSLQRPQFRLLIVIDGFFRKVLEDGFQFQDRHYRSLTPIAREITGAHWSGPRFFGLKEKASAA